MSTLKGRQYVATASPKRSLFRSKTVQAYIQSREKSVLPRIVAPPVFALCWIVLTLLIIACIIIWSGQVPTYITGSGIISAPSTLSQQDSDATALILFPISDLAYLQSGLSIQVQVGQAGTICNCSIATVSQNPLSPYKIHLQYGLEVSAPAIIVTTTLGPAISESLYAGSPVQAKLQIGSQSLLSLFPIVNSL
jgi:hypothetical protein